MYSFPATVQRTIVSLATDWRWDQVLPQLVDRCLWTLIVLTPFVWGGRGDGARAIYALVCGATVLVWLADSWIGQRAGLRFSRVLLIPAIAASWLALQLTPLPAAVLDTISPSIRHYLPWWNSEENLAELGIGRWATLSLHPTATHVSLAVLLCYAMALWVLIQRIQTKADVRLVLKWIAQAAIGMALFGLLQYLTADGLFFWVFEHPFRRSDDHVCGSFINRNHFASFLAMGAAAIVYQLIGSESPPQPMQRQSLGPQRNYRAALSALGLAVVLLAMIMSASRGGILAAVAGAAVMVGMGWKSKLWGGKQFAYLCFSVVLLGTGLTLYSEDRLTQRLEDLTSGSVENLDRLGGRRAIWAANLQAIGAFWLTGSGAGTHQDVYPLFIPRSFPKVFTHAENGYLQIATELGLAGVLLLMSALACLVRWTLIAWWSTRSREQTACLGAVTGALTVSLVHSGCDFVWYIPATMTTAIVLIVLLRRLALNEQSDRAQFPSQLPVPRELTVAILAAVAYVGVVLLPPARASFSWNRYIASSARLDKAQQPAYGDLADDAQLRSLNDHAGLLELEIAALRDTLKVHPHSADAHMRLSRAYLQWFDSQSEAHESRVNLGQLQGAVQSNAFTSSKAVDDWLAVVIGDELRILRAAQQHAVEAIRLAPLDGIAYVYLANLDFLDNRIGTHSQPLLKQAAVLGPQDGTLLFEIGKQYLLAGNLALAIDHWVRCYEHDGRHRMLVVAALAGNIPATEFLETFSPDWQTLRCVWQRYLAIGDRSQLGVLLAYATQETENYQPAPHEIPAAYVWQWLGDMHGDAGDRGKQIECIQQAMQVNPSLYSVRKAYAVALFKDERYAEAEPHLRWCVARDPSNAGIRNCLHQAATLRHSQRRRTTASPVSDNVRR